MRPLTIDLDRLRQAIDSQDLAEHYLDQQSGDICTVMPGDPVPGADEKYDIEPDRYLPIERLDLAQQIAMREAFLYTLHDPDAHAAHAVLTEALAGRKPLRTFDFKLEDFPRIKDHWLRYQAVQLREYAITWLHDKGLEPSRY
ncbi:hypothetical protein JQR85_02485 [Stutzerimonas urumqiensis]|uniref:UPF0158 family protein n=1 Tax=Stutzerimonas urumqiensis TaxID=638269 RepID=UPI003DA3DA3E